MVVSSDVAIPKRNRHCRFAKPIAKLWAATLVPAANGSAGGGIHEFKCYRADDRLIEWAFGENT